MTKRGRPTIAAKPGTRASLGLKVTSDMKARIEMAARQSGRTQSQEAEARLERTFRDDEVLAELRTANELLVRYLANSGGSVR